MLYSGFDNPNLLKFAVGAAPGVAPGWDEYRYLEQNFFSELAAATIIIERTLVMVRIRIPKEALSAVSMVASLLGLGAFIALAFFYDAHPESFVSVCIAGKIQHDGDTLRQKSADVWCECAPQSRSTLYESR
jgi:hypothetical protein